VIDEHLSQARAEVAAMARRVFERGLVGGTGGNVSLRLPDTNQILITRTGLALGRATPYDILRLSLTGETLEAGPAQQPSMETPIHLSGYKLRPDVQAIIHLHPPYSVVLSLRGEPLPLVTVSARLLLRHVPCAPVAYPKTARLDRAMEQVFDRCPEAGVVLMAAHGLTAYGHDLDDAFNLADLCEASAQQAYLAESLGLRFVLPEPEEL
jgi:L-ribulose-5-phosphate 4-epimerase